MQKGKIYLIPNVLSEGTIAQTVPQPIVELIQTIDQYIVENTKNARRYLRDLGIKTNLDQLHFFEINEHTNLNALDLEQMLNPIMVGGQNMGLISDAGCPAIADPGAAVVAKAHELGIEIVPLVGASSVLLALMASGMNGQNFAFNGYLPIDKIELKKKILSLEQKIYAENQTQLFIETPYRNQQLFETICTICKPNTRLCVAANLTAENEFIQTKTLQQWAKATINIHKQPAVFVLGK